MGILDAPGISSVVAARQASTEAAEDFGVYANGPVPAKIRSGQTALSYGANDVAGRQPAIAGGKLTYTDTAQFLGSYYQIQLEGTAVMVSAGFTFSPWTTGGGLACIAVMEQDFVAYHRANNAVPRSPFHLTVSPEAWSLTVFPTAGAASVNVVGGLWRDGNLAADSTTVHRVTAYIDVSAGTAVIFLPDGTVSYASHAALKIPGRYVYIEPFRDAASGRTLAAFTDFHADSRRTNLLPLARTLDKPRVRAVEAFPGSASNVTLTTTPSAVAGVTVNYVVPTSGTVMVTLSGLLDVTTDGPVHFGIFDASNALVAVRTVATKISNGQRTVTIPYTRTDYGAKATVKMCVYRDAAAAATLILGNSGSVYGSASITVTPI